MRCKFVSKIELSKTTVVEFVVPGPQPGMDRSQVKTSIGRSCEEMLVF